MQDHDCIDFTDNDIATLGNFPLTPRIRTLLLARNRVATIQPTLPKSIPNLESIVLTQNRIAELADLDMLGQFPKLTHVVLLDNPVTSKEVSYCAQEISLFNKVDVGCRTIGIGSSGGVQVYGFLTTRRSRTQSVRKLRSSLVASKSQLHSQRRLLALNREHSMRELRRMARMAWVVVRKA